MSARILVVDDILANVRLLEARLSAEYFEVVTAMSGAEAIEICEHSPCDIILLDVMMPGMDGFEVCRHLKANAATAHIPIVMVTALDQPQDRVRGLEAGADDFLTKPVNDVALLARIRSLVRLKILTDELRSRALTSQQMGVPDPLSEASLVTGDGGQILIVDDRPSSSDRMASMLSGLHQVSVEPSPQEALFRLAEGEFDVAIVSCGFADYDALRLCSQIRSLERTRHLPLLIVANPDENARVLRGLDLGVNDYLLRPVDRNELAARVRTQVKRKRYSDRLRDNVQLSLEMAVTDTLTGLHNRRYYDSHANAAVELAARRNKALSLLILDIDHFKSINDTYGHDAGDEVLREFAHRVRKNLRNLDLPCRLGGEEFVVVMPDTDMMLATVVAERVRRKIERDRFPIQGGRETIEVTVSIGAASLTKKDDTAQTILKRADQALYRAKREGRNRVVADAA